jgi:predicted nucleic acid-binding protein
VGTEVICVDTTFLVDLWRERGVDRPRAASVLESHPGETFSVPAHAAGEFLEGGASISTDRLAESLAFVRAFRISEVDLDTALRYAEVVAELRTRSGLAGRSKPDLWIAASAIRGAMPLVTRNARDFADIPGLQLITY